jgi:hypothetical protein
MRTIVPCLLILTFASFGAEAQQRNELIAGVRWKFPGLAGPIAALQAPLGAPNSLALANNGDLLIADEGNDIVLRLSADGTIPATADPRLPHLLSIPRLSPSTGQTTSILRISAKRLQRPTPFVAFVG